MSQAKRTTATRSRTVTGRSAVNVEIGKADAEFVPAVLTPMQARFINALEGATADSVLAEELYQQVSAKLSYNRSEGKDGWHRTNVTNAELHDMMVDLVNKGDYIDVAIVAGMLLMRQQMLFPE